MAANHGDEEGGLDEFGLLLGLDDTTSDARASKRLKGRDGLEGGDNEAVPGDVFMNGLGRSGRKRRTRGSRE